MEFYVVGLDVLERRHHFWKAIQKKATMLLSVNPSNFSKCV